MTTMYVDALATDNDGTHAEMCDWLHEVMPGRYNVSYNWDAASWVFDFHNENDAMLFKLRWNAK